MGRLLGAGAKPVFSEASIEAKLILPLNKVEGRTMTITK
jgi:hypothetical protein